MATQDTIKTMDRNHAVVKQSQFKQAHQQLLSFSPFSLWHPEESSGPLECFKIETIVFVLRFDLVESESSLSQHLTYHLADRRAVSALNTEAAIPFLVENHSNIHVPLRF